MRLVLFDIDGTLVPLPGTERRFARYLIRNGRMGPRQVAGWCWFVLRYLPRFGRDVLRKNKGYLHGLPTTDVDRLAEGFVQEVLLANLHEPSLARLRQHLSAGDRLVLLSGTPQFIAQPLARELGAAGACGTRCCERDGVFKARPPLRHPYGEDKVKAAKALAAAHDLPLSEAMAYGDSISDADLFHAVGHSVAVMPDRRLQAMAGGEGWEQLPR